MIVYTGEELYHSDLIIDAIYKGYKTDRGGISDPLVRLVGVSRQGGFRYRGTKSKPDILVLTSNLVEPDWPDELDSTTGRFVYYGDNRKPGLQLHETIRHGNFLLRSIFDQSHSGRRSEIPPILIFTKEGEGRSYRFRGLAVPGHPSTPSNEDLVAVWRTSGNERFQNYRAVFTILDCSTVKRDWIHSVGEGEHVEVNAPEALKKWIKNGVAKPLLAPKTQLVRTKIEQLPATVEGKALLNAIKNKFEKNPYGFEVCAGEITKLLLSNVSRLDLTRPWRDGGRDGIGSLRIGKGPASIEAAFALEAKCYAHTNSVGVREVSRLISRIKHREFGVLVTTSFVDKQAYKEVVDDGHPVILVTGADIVHLLRDAGHSSIESVNKWLDGLSNTISP